MKACWKKFLRCSSNLVKKLLQSTAGTMWTLFSCHFFAFLLFSFACGILIALGFAFWRFPSLFSLFSYFFSYPIIFHPFLISGQFADWSWFSRGSQRWLENCITMMHEEKLTTVLIMEKKWLDEDLILVFSYLKMYYREEGARFFGCGKWKDKMQWPKLQL